MITKEIPYFDIFQICNSGQCFRMQQTGDDTCQVIAGEYNLKIKQEGSRCTFFCTEEEFESFWKDYFDLQTDYRVYRDKINPRDIYLCQAAEFGKGIRILKQDLWEMIVSFLISQQNNIPRIRRCIQNICQQYGKSVKTEEGDTFYTFPKPESLAVLGEDDLKSCNLGYRSKYVVRTARMISNGEVSLEEIEKMSYKKAKEELLKLFGVGEKVADCICLFALHHLEAFPMDTHMIQALEHHYKRGFPKRRYQGFQGVMQQYIFYWELFGKKNR